MHGYIEISVGSHMHIVKFSTCAFIVVSLGVL